MLPIFFARRASRAPARPSPSSQTAKISKWAPLPKFSDQPYCRETDLKNPPYTGPAGTFEYLGHKRIDGVEIRGQRETYYTSVQAKLSGSPPVRVFENWCSLSLDSPMGNYSLDDKPKRETITVISDIKQIEPDPALFEIPEGYKITRDDQNAPAPRANGSPTGFGREYPGM